MQRFIHDLRIRRLRAPGRHAGVASALIFGAGLVLAGCQVSSPVASRGETPPLTTENFPRGTRVSVLEARALAVEQPPERAIELLERAAFRFPLNDANLRFIVAEPVTLEVKRYMEARARDARPPEYSPRVEREPVTPRINRFTRPKNWPYGPYYDPSPDGS